MLNRFIAVVLVVAAVLLLAAPVASGGDQVRGAKGQGGVHQEQMQDPPPFQP